MSNPNHEERFSRCPHCGKILEYRYTTPYECGCPRIVCKYCGRQHFDGFYQEKALVEYRKRAPMWNVWICAAFVVYCLYMDYRMFRIGFENLLPESIIAFSIMTVVSIVLLLIALHRRENREEYVASREKKMEERFRNAAEQDKVLAVSLNRMGNEDYLYYLIDNEVDVPDYFFRRAGIQKDTERIEKARRKKKLQYEIKRCRDELEYYEYYLALGVDDRIFRQQAQSKGMEFQPFEDYCRGQAEICRQKLTELEAEEAAIK